MAGLREFVVQFGTEEQYIEQLASFALTTWFVAAYLLGREKRGVSAKFLQRELGETDQTASTMAHKQRHGLSEDPLPPLHGFSRKRTRPLSVVAATRQAPVTAPPTPTRAWLSLPSKRCRHQRTGAESTGTPSNASTGSSPVLPASPCCRRQAGPNWGPSSKPIACPCESRDRRQFALTDGFAGYRGADLGAYLKHTPVAQDDSANAGEFFPIIHTLFSNIKAWLVRTHHGVSTKHLPRYPREWSYRFNRRNLPDGLDRI